MGSNSYRIIWGFFVYYLYEIICEFNSFWCEERQTENTPVQEVISILK